MTRISRTARPGTSARTMIRLRRTGEAVGAASAPNVQVPEELAHGPG